MADNSKVSRVGNTFTNMDDVLTNLITGSTITNMPQVPAEIESGTGFFTNTRTGNVTAVGTPSKKTLAPAAPAVPATAVPAVPTVSSAITTVGTKNPAIESIISLINTATLEEDKLDYAFKLKNMAQEQALIDYNKFAKQAEARFSVPDLEGSIDLITKQELVDPNRPAGAISDQRLALLGQLGKARAESRLYVADLVRGNIEVNKAMVLADSIVAGFKLSDDKIALRAKQEEETYKQQRKLELLADTKFLDRVNALTTGSISPTQMSRERIATQIALNPKSLDSKTEQLAKMSKDDLYSLLFMPDIKDQDKSSIKNALMAEEVTITGNAEKAKKSMKVVEAVLNLNFDEQKLTDIIAQFPAAAKNEVGLLVNEHKKARGVKAGAGKRENLAAKDIANTLLAFDVDAKRKLIRIVSTAVFSEDVKAWQGLIQADETAIGLIAKADKSKPYNAPQFVADYINSGQKNALNERVVKLRNMVNTASIAYDNGSILPPMNPASLEIMIDRMALTAIEFRFANLQGKSFTEVGESYNDALRMPRTLP